MEKSQVTGIESWKVVRVKLRRLGLVVVDRKKKIVCSTTTTVQLVFA